MLDDNRLTLAIDEYRGRIAALDPARAADLDAAMAIAFDEHFAYQNAQAQAHAAGRIATSEALTIYAALGEIYTDGNGGWAAGTDLATKVTVTVAMREILDGNMAARL